MQTELKEALAALKAIEFVLTGKGQKHVAQYMKRELVQRFVKTKLLNEQHHERGGLKEDLEKAHKEYKDICEMIDHYKRQTGNDGKTTSDSPLNKNLG